MPRPRATNPHGRKVSVRLTAAEEARVIAAAQELPRTPRGALNMSAGVRALLAVAPEPGGTTVPISAAGAATLDELARSGEDRAATARRLLSWAAQHHPDRRKGRS